MLQLVAEGDHFLPSSRAGTHDVAVMEEEKTPNRTYPAKRRAQSAPRVYGLPVMESRLVRPPHDALRGRSGAEPLHPLSRPELVPEGISNVTGK